jgi:hypothetical protein
MLCLAHNLATQRTQVLQQPVWRYRFDLVESNLNQYGSIVGAFHGTAPSRTACPASPSDDRVHIGVDIRFVMGTWRYAYERQARACRKS